MPFTGDRDASILFSVVHEQPKPLRDAAPGVPREFEQVVHRALQKDLAARYQSAGEMLEDLRNYRDSLKAEELGALTPRRAWRLLRNPKIAVAVAASLIATIAFSVWFLAPEQNPLGQGAGPAGGRAVVFELRGRVFEPPRSI